MRHAFHFYVALSAGNERTLSYPRADFTTFTSSRSTSSSICHSAEEEEEEEGVFKDEGRAEREHIFWRESGDPQTALHVYSPRRRRRPPSPCGQRPADEGDFDVPSLRFYFETLRHNPLLGASYLFLIRFTNRHGRRHEAQLPEAASALPPP
ncbi:unnamed protein product [Heligmosomoides polygyrus]|uniref:Uncharacterized protein n=1 Tax=Heligmosomoides polygyrus TaxID=6339 RepID=A0A183FSJ1_HELPZ|nr:unnamed protein product [Heligmosomoides polygyrus]